MMIRVCVSQASSPESLFAWTDIALSAGRLAMPAGIGPVSELPACTGCHVWRGINSSKYDSKTYG